MSIRLPPFRLSAAERRHGDELTADPAAPPTGELHYRLATELPENWYPLLPHQAGLRAILFQLGQATSGPNPTPPLGAVLSFSSPLRIQEEDLYRAACASAG